MLKTLRIIPALLLLTISISQTFAQLSGTYTINAAAAASATNYTSFAAAVYDLSFHGTRPDGGPGNGPGISGPVIFNIASGTYSESITLYAVSGTSLVNTITFKGQDSSNTKLSNSLSPVTFKL